MKQRQVNSIFLNVGHFLDHFVMLIFASVAALSLTSEWSMSYSELIPYATLGFMAFGACALIAGWVADKWSRKGMLFIFFLGIGFSSLLSGLSNDPNQLAIGLLLIGIFASIYHPVGLAMVVEGRDKTGIPLAINGVFGNMGVASSALITGILIDNYGWRSAFFIPGIIATCIGFLYLVHIWHDQKRSKRENTTKKPVTNDQNNLSKSIIIKAFGIIFFSTAMGGFIFQSTTFSLPKMIDELLNESATMIGWYSFIIFSIAALAQLIVGHLVDRHSVKLVFSTVAFMQFLLFMLMTQVNAHYALFVAAGFMLFVFGQIPINDVLVSRLVKSEWRSRAYAIRYVLSFTVMALTLPLIAWIHDKWGFNMLFNTLAMSAFMIFLATLLLPSINRD